MTQSISVQRFERNMYNTYADQVHIRHLREAEERRKVRIAVGYFCYGNSVWDLITQFMTTESLVSLYENIVDDANDPEISAEDRQFLVECLPMYEKIGMEMSNNRNTVISG